jgi:hypothetical protein
VKSVVAELVALRALTLDDLAARYEQEIGRPPRVRNRDAMFRRLAYAVQERRTGGLPNVARARLEQLIGEIELPATAPTRTRDGLAVGTVLTRVWRDRTLVLRVTDAGFECDGTVYASLSAAANAITNSRWNGKLFWRVSR